MTAPSTAQPAEVTIPQTRCLIDGAWAHADTGATFPVTDPATGDTLAEVPLMGAAETRRAIEAAHTAFPGWAARTAGERAAECRRAPGAANCRRSCSVVGRPVTGRFMAARTGSSYGDTPMMPGTAPETPLAVPQRRWLGAAAVPRISQMVAAPFRSCMATRPCLGVDSGLPAYRR